MHSQDNTDGMTNSCSVNVSIKQLNVSCYSIYKLKTAYNAKHASNVVDNKTESKTLGTSDTMHKKWQYCNKSSDSAAGSMYRPYNK